jgi:hypothetical protein
MLLVISPPNWRGDAAQQGSCFLPLFGDEETDEPPEVTPFVVSDEEASRGGDQGGQKSGRSAESKPKGSSTRTYDDKNGYDVLVCM